MLGIFPAFLSVNNRGTTVFTAITVFFLNASIGGTFSFQFRWALIVYPWRAKNVKKIWIYVYCITVHLTASALFIWLSLQMNNNPEFEHVTPPVFCFTSDQSRFLITVIVIVAAAGLGTATMIALTVWSYVSLAKQTRQLSEKTVKFQKRFLRNLIILTSVSIVLGAVPSIISWICFYLHFESLKTLTVVSLLVLQNHGTILAVTVLATFSSYRNAVIVMMRRVLRPRRANVSISRMRT